MDIEESDLFRFKQFVVYNPRNVFRVNTDGVLLGAWCDIRHSRHVLDLGCGTGVIALMLYQRNPKLKLTAIDNNKDAISASKVSLGLNNIKDIALQHTSFYDVDIEKLSCDHIISNPPFFLDGSLPTEEVLHNAKHNFSFEDMMHKLHALCSKPRYISMIMPPDTFTHYIDLAMSIGYRLVRKRQVVDKQNVPIRILSTIEYRPDNDCQIIEPNLLIQTGKNRNYTTDYKELTKDFYLNF